MKFELQKSEIQKIALEHSYTANNIEKVIRLSFILNDLNAHTEFNGKLLLKGGTAINLLAFAEPPRLSVDLDLDFAEDISKERMMDERDKINRALVLYCQENDYEVTQRKSFSLDSYSLYYITVTGSRDKIKLDINYHNRCHILPYVVTQIPFPFSVKDGMLNVAHLALPELFGGKIKAFHERCKPRDIYDIYSLAQSGILSAPEERDLLRKCTVFYSTLGNPDNPCLLEQDVRHILEMPFQDIKAQLLPMLHINAGKYPKDEINHCVIDYLSALMTLDETEQKYMDEFYKGNYSPNLLFDDEIAVKLLNHPVALRTQQQIMKSKSKDEIENG